MLLDPLDVRSFCSFGSRSVRLPNPSLQKYDEHTGFRDVSITPCPLQGGMMRRLELLPHVRLPLVASFVSAAPRRSDAFRTSFSSLPFLRAPTLPQARLPSDACGWCVHVLSHDTFLDASDEARKKDSWPGCNRPSPLLQGRQIRTRGRS